MNAGDHRWLSAHIFFRGNVHGDEADRVIVEFIKPLLEQCTDRGWIRRFFFIRYWEDGYHIRVRVVPKQFTRPLIRRAFEDGIVTMDPSLAATPIADLPAWFTRTQHPWLFWTRYFPEWDRYGGRRGVFVAEHLFGESSKMTLALLPDILARRLDRVGLAMAQTVSTLFALTLGDRSEASAIARAYQLMLTDETIKRTRADSEGEFAAFLAERRDNLECTANRVWRGAAVTSLPPVLMRHVRANAVGRNSLARLVRRGQLFDEASGLPFDVGEAIRRLAPSYIHMTNNRLGLPRPTEAFLGYALWQILGESSDS
jgi:thiopeptide-type bacteriocin biosynthesis protein